MADRSDKREYRVKVEGPGNSKAGIKSMDTGPGRKIKMRKDAASARQDVEFGEAMETNMNKFSRDLTKGRTIDEDWKNRTRYDGNKNLETGGDLTFIDKMYTPAVRMPDNPERGDVDTKINANFESGEDNTYFWNNGGERSIEQNRQKKRLDNNGKQGPK